MPLQSLLTNPGQFLLNLVYTLPGLIIGLTFHEFAHAWVSDRLGDPTPRQMGRVTLNPLAHMDPLGLLLLVTVGFGFGKAVPVNSRYYKDKTKGQILVSLAGVTTNFIIAFLTLPIYLLLLKNGANAVFTTIVGSIVSTNVVLMVFNLLPIPPLDGYKVVKSLFMRSERALNFFWQVERLGYAFLMILIMTNISGSWVSFLTTKVLDLLMNFWIFIIF